MKILLPLTLTLALTLAPSMIATAQTSAPFTPTTSPPTAPNSLSQDIQQTGADLKGDLKDIRAAQNLELRIRRLIGEVQAGRSLTTAQREELNNCQDQLDVERARGDSLERSNTLATEEISRRTTAQQHLTTSLGAEREAKQLLQTRNQILQAAAARNRKRAAIAITVAAAVVAYMVWKK